MTGRFRQCYCAYVQSTVDCIHRLVNDNSGLRRRVKVTPSRNETKMSGGHATHGQCTGSAGSVTIALSRVNTLQFTPISRPSARESPTGIRPRSCCELHIEILLTCHDLARNQ